MNHFTNEHTLIKSKKPSLEQSTINKIRLIETVTPNSTQSDETLVCRQ